MGEGNISSLTPGTVIANRYEVIKCLGAGSMGLVYACRNRDLAGHMVAVKVLFNEVAQDAIAAQRFQSEIVASYGVSHTNVVRAYEYVRDGDMLAYSMEYVGGGDLADRLARPDDLLPIPQILSLLAQMCAGVQAIHDAGIVHRDLKPENILLTKEGQVKITDFGIARTGHGPCLTEHGGVVGTLDYVSPEYMLNSQVDWRSDIYALGVLAYEMITGEAPFRGESVYATMTKRLKQDPNPPSSLRSDCPPSLDAVVLKMLARDPEMRYQSASEILEDIEAFSSSSLPLHHTSVMRRAQLSANKEHNDEPIGKGSRPVAPRIDPPLPLVDTPSSHQSKNDVPTSSGYRPSDKPTTEFSRDEVLSAFGSGASLDAFSDPTGIRQRSDLGTSRETLHQPIDASPYRHPALDSTEGSWDVPSEAQNTTDLSGGTLSQERVSRLIGRSQVAPAKSGSLFWSMAALSTGIVVGATVLRVFFPNLL